jgi:hypothetical protein
MRASHNGSDPNGDYIKFVVEVQRSRNAHAVLMWDLSSNPVEWFGSSNVDSDR